MERVFYNAHDNVCRLTLRKSTPLLRSLIENSVLFLAVTSFCAVILSHRTFVYRGGAIKSQAVSYRGWNIPTMCLKSIHDFREDVDVTHVMVHDVQNLNQMDEGEKVFSSNLQEATNFESISCGATQKYHNSSFVTSVEPWARRDVSTIARESDVYHSKTCLSSVEMQSPLPPSVSQNIVYSFSRSKGFLVLSPSILPFHNISSQYVYVYSNDTKCFSNDPWLQYIVQRFPGLRNIVALNWILGLSNGINAFIHIHRNGEIINVKEYINEYSFQWPTKSVKDQQENNESMSSRHSSATSNTSTSTSSSSMNNSHKETASTVNRVPWHHHYLIFKAGVLISSLFLFFATTTLVSFTLRESQDRMLHFTLQLQLHIRNRQPYANLIISHVMENMVFVPIMIGIVFFLTYACYNGDKFLAFVILSGVWICEVFSAISMRTIHSSIYFPQVFFLYFTLFHVYYFSCPFGFSYEALASTVLFQLHSMIFFLNRYELPAIFNGQISHETPRMYLSNNYAPPSPRRTNAETSDNNETNHRQDVSSSGQEIQRFGSYPSMSSLGRINVSSNITGRDQNGYYTLMDGEIFIRQNSMSSFDSLRRHQ